MPRYRLLVWMALCCTNLAAGDTNTISHAKHDSTLPRRRLLLEDPATDQAETPPETSPQVLDASPPPADNGGYQFTTCASAQTCDHCKTASEEIKSSTTQGYTCLWMIINDANGGAIGCELVPAAEAVADMCSQHPASRSSSSAQTEQPDESKSLPSTSSAAAISRSCTSATICDHCKKASKEAKSTTQGYSCVWRVNDGAFGCELIQATEAVAGDMCSQHSWHPSSDAQMDYNWEDEGGIDNTGVVLLAVVLVGAAAIRFKPFARGGRRHYTKQSQSDPSLFTAQKGKVRDCSGLTKRSIAFVC